MARKPRIHYPGALYHVMIRGNGGQDIFYSNSDRSRFYLLLQEGVERYKHRIHAFCLMSNHVHLLIEVEIAPLSQVMQNISFRYTRYFNAGRNKTGHLFQGRYKALLIDGDSYFKELVRYIHCNPVRAGLVSNPVEYQWSSHHLYLGTDAVPWLTTNELLGHFDAQEDRARQLYQKFIQAGIMEKYRQEYHAGICEGRILGDEHFSDKALALAEERIRIRYSLPQLIDAVCVTYGIALEVLAEPGKKQPGATARAVTAFLVQEESHHLSLTDLGNTINREVSSLSRAAGRIRERGVDKSGLAEKIKEIRRNIKR